MGAGDRHYHEGQARIAIKEVTNGNDKIIDQEKLDLKLAAQKEYK
jgi:hypothetical protein